MELTASPLSSRLAFGPSHSFEQEMEQKKVLGFWERRECQASELVQSFVKLHRHGDCKQGGLTAAYGASSASLLLDVAH